MSEIGADVVGPRVACLTEGYLLPFVLSPTMKSQTNAQAEEYKSSNQSFLRNVMMKVSPFIRIISSEENSNRTR